MAITNADGSIILTTKVDTKGVDSGFNKIQSKAKSLTNTMSKLGGVLVGVFSVTALVNFSKEASNLAIEQEANVMRLIDIYGEASNAVGDFIDQNARALGMSKASATAFSSVYGNLFSVWADQATNAELTNRYLNMTAVIASKTGRTVEDVQERIRSGLLGNTEAVEDLGVFVNVKTIEITEAFQRIADGRSWEQLTAYEQSQVRTLAILEQSTKKYGDQVADTTALTRSQFLASYQDMQATWGQFVNVVLVPVLGVVTKIMDIITAGMRAIAGLTGNVLGDFNAEEEKTKKTEKNIKKQGTNQKALNKELKKTLAGFDELNTLSQDTGSGGTSVGDDSVIDYLSDTFSNKDYVSEIDATLTAIMGIVGISLVAIGLILLFTGHIGWGVGFIIAGAFTVGVTMASASQTDHAEKVIGLLSAIMGAVGGAMVAIGIVLIMLGSTAVGVGLIVAGAVNLIGSVGSLVGFNVASVQNVLKTITAIAGGFMLALGIMLTIFGGPTPLSIGLIVAGAVSLASSVALNFGAVTEALQGEIGFITYIVSSALLVIGVILLFTGVATPLGIGLIVAGLAGTATVVSLNWNFIVDKVKEIWNKVKAFWNSYIAPVFTAKWWQDLGKNALNGLITVFENTLNFITFGFRKLANTASTLINAVGGALGLDWNIPSIPKISLPRLAQGAVIPPNREFMAILGDQKHGTNIEAPLDTIVQAFNMALQNNGGGGFNGRIEVPVIIDGRQIALAVREAENNLGSQTVFGGFANAY
jgi:hypothetical protein